MQVKKLWIYLCSYARRANPFWQERRYAETLSLLGEVSRELDRARDNAKLHREENSKLRADIAAIAEAATRVRYERAHEVYRIVLDITPERFNYGTMSYDALDVFAESVGRGIASEIRRARFVRPGDASTSTPPNYLKGELP